jgi:acyl-CoA thioesterase
MNAQDRAERIVHQLMLGNDLFSQWMGIAITDLAPGTCTLQAQIQPNMLNGFGICHGGITFSLADSAFAFASNSHGIQSVSIETSISHTKAVKADDIITAKAIEKNLTSKLGIYEVTLTNQNGEIVALFKGTVFRTGKEWEV